VLRNVPVIYFVFIEIIGEQMGKNRIEKKNFQKQGAKMCAKFRELNIDDNQEELSLFDVSKNLRCLISFYRDIFD
jgi:hypothetical protein